MCVRGVKNRRALMSSVANALRQRCLELYVIINKATWLYYSYYIILLTRSTCVQRTWQRGSVHRRASSPVSPPRTHETTRNT